MSDFPLYSRIHIHLLLVLEVHLVFSSMCLNLCLLHATELTPPQQPLDGGSIGIPFPVLVLPLPLSLLLSGPTAWNTTYIPLPTSGYVHLGHHSKTHFQLDISGDLHGNVSVTFQ